jgi:signal transduction histidine kinase
MTSAVSRPHARHDASMMTPRGKRAGLRTRVVGGFALGTLVLSASMAFATYEVMRSALLSGRERSTVRAAAFDARVVGEGLSGQSTDVAELLRSLDTGGSRRTVLYRGGRWYARSAGTSAPDAIPDVLQRYVQSGRTGIQRTHVDGSPVVVVGTRLADGTELYEIDSLAELDGTLRVLGWVLAIVAAVISAAGAALGWYAARYVLRPLQDVVHAAEGVAEGDLTTRLDPATEPDLATLTTSFNRMVDRLTERIERDRRFAADVSHELRSPLQTLSAAASVLDRRRDRLDDRTALAAGLIVQEVSRFESLVGDLLELARSDRSPHRATVDVAEIAHEVCTRHGVSPDRVVVPDDAAAAWYVDPRRVGQIIGNLVDNAIRYGGGVTAIRLAGADRVRVIEVDDEGPGVSPDDKAKVFERFVRGRVAHARGDDGGTGLGLALVAEHAAAHGGRAEVLDRPGGGARFRVELREHP